MWIVLRYVTVRFPLPGQGGERFDQRRQMGIAGIHRLQQLSVGKSALRLAAVAINKCGKDKDPGAVKRIRMEGAPSLENGATWQLKPFEEPAAIPPGECLQVGCRKRGQALS